MTLELNGLAVACIVGERPEERLAPQKLRVDVAMDIDDTAARTDCLADTVDYAHLAQLLRDALVAEKQKMIERAAKVALDAVLRDGKGRRATVKVTKSGAVPHLESASATCCGGR